MNERKEQIAKYEKIQRAAVKALWVQFLLAVVLGVAWIWIDYADRIPKMFFTNGYLAIATAVLYVLLELRIDTLKDKLYKRPRL